jgi:1,4-dihydroxy-6-naphthoate synthase
MSTATYSLGISPCPNDTFIFDALINRRVPAPFTVAAHMADVEELNALACRNALDITKLSLAAALHVLDHYMLLNSGAALGRGCGPLVVARPGLAQEAFSTARIAIPGRLTTANLLLSLNGQFHGPRTEMLFDQIMPALLAKKADLGVIIHESRFTYANQGLTLVVDLGTWWEKHTGFPLPLGVIAVKRNMGKRAAMAVQDAIQRSLNHAYAAPEDSKKFIRFHAQEMDDAIISAHITAFVNDFSLDLGSEGRNAVIALLQAAQKEHMASHPATPTLSLAVQTVFAPFPVAASPLSI